MSMVFFKIDSTDLTPDADIQNYNVNKDDVFSSWTDGNWLDHREVVRTRISGTFQLGFKSATAWSAFQTLLGAARNEAGYYSVTVYVNNTGTTETINAFLEISATAKWDLLNGLFWKVVDVALTER